MLRSIFYSPPVNLLFRTCLHPFRRMIPEGLQFPVSGTISVSLPEGRSIRMQTNPTCFLAKRLFWNGFEGFERVQSKVFIQLISEADVFLDVGANVGYYSLLASAYRPNIRIEAFEPLPAAFRYLQDNLRLNGSGNSTAHNVAVSDRVGTETFYFSRNPSFNFVHDQLTSTGSLDRSQATHTEDPVEINAFTVTLDGFVRENDLSRVDVIKLDTEATEDRVLSGSEWVLREFRPHIFCEVLPGKIEKRIEAILEPAGYLMLRLGGAGIEKVDSLSHVSDTTNDHLFVHHSRLDHVYDILDRTLSG
jgi:FkbM family methyltransferase